jgi:hypothetical protein
MTGCSLTVGFTSRAEPEDLETLARELRQGLHGNPCSAVRLSVLTLACYTVATHSDGRPQCVVRCPIAAQHGHILRRECRANIKLSTLTTHDLEQVASFSTDVSGMASVGRGGSPHISRSDGDLYVTIQACTKHDDSDMGAHGAECSGMPHSGFLVDTVLACTDWMEQVGVTRPTP